MKNQTRPITLVRILLMLVVVILLPFLPLLITGRWDWWEAWVYALLWVLGFAASRALAARRHPDILSERARFTDHADIQPWDKWLSPLVGVGAGVIPIAAGLEVRLQGPVDFPLLVEAAALVIILAGYVIASYALIENRYFSGVVRLQTERGHQVVSGGPYHWVRHPGYAGALLTYLATPFFLDSLWALAAAVLVAAVLVVRTALEDRFLQAELAGYREYARSVRYRLLPGVW